MPKKAAVLAKQRQAVMYDILKAAKPLQRTIASRVAPLCEGKTTAEIEVIVTAEVTKALSKVGKPTSELRKLLRSGDAI